MKTKYVLGFAFDKNNNVLLVRKNRPTWQAGKLNGIGGKVEDFDYTDVHAMQREFKEEAGVETNLTDWNLTATMEGNDWEVLVFTLEKMLDDITHLDGASTDTDEKLKVVNLADLLSTKNLIDNVPMLIAMCLDSDIKEKRYTIRT